MIFLSSMNIQRNRRLKWYLYLSNNDKILSLVIRKAWCAAILLITSGKGMRIYFVLIPSYVDLSCFVISDDTLFILQQLLTSEKSLTCTLILCRSYIIWIKILHSMHILSRPKVNYKNYANNRKIKEIRGRKLMKV